MRKPKSTILKKIVFNIKLAQFSNENPEIEIDKIVEFGKADPYSRRKFVSDVAKFGLLSGVIGSTVLACKKEEETPQNKNTPDTNQSRLKEAKIVIVGAGIAGLNAAYQLKKMGANPILYEGSHRLGGRILTHKGDALQMGIHPEFGGDFIDSNHADILSLVKEFDLELTDMYQESHEAKLKHETFFFDNRHLSEEEIIKEFKKIASKLSKDAESLGEDYDTKEALLLDKMSLEQYISSLSCANWLKEILTAAYLAEFGLDTSEQSAINLLDMIDTNTSEGFKIFGESDEKYRIKGGNSLLIETLASKMQEAIHMNAMLTAIGQKDRKYLLTFNQNEIVEADYVVLALPFTMLRKVKMDLPNLSQAKKDAIQELGYGQNNKLFLGFENRPWREGKNKFYGYLFHKDIHDGWDSSAVKSISSNKGVYCCFFGGKDSIHLSRVAINNPYAPKSHVWKTDLPQNEINKYITELNTVFPGSKEKYNGKHVFACWSSYPYVQGSYTCPKPGQWNGAMLHISEPIGDIYFAGEHCSVDFQGYMNGAVETGRLAAEAIYKKIK